MARELDRQLNADRNPAASPAPPAPELQAPASTAGRRSRWAIPAEPFEFPEVASEDTLPPAPANEDALGRAARAEAQAAALAAELEATRAELRLARGQLWALAEPQWLRAADRAVGPPAAPGRARGSTYYLAMVLLTAAVALALGVGLAAGAC
eukprot:TRINITY_DN1940_c3_g1_i10.p2 TRINITY_DN1940_c3_g1~~TRINITY_DN1940_c3_g1_i10.p2  ORF type:complete len:153 (+),score=41.73 TRINITY_DN1940_c3_g1_i10:474-932(+)